MAATSFQRLGHMLIVTVHEQMLDSEADGLLLRVGEKLVEHGARGMLVDLSGLSLVDSYIGRILVGMARAAMLLGAETMMVGIRPAVAITIVELGMDFAGLMAAPDLETGLADLRKRIGQGL